MTKLQFINRELLDRMAAAASEAPRRRKNYDFHLHESDLSNRLLNAVEPDSYVQPHRHLDAGKDETMVALRGKFGVVFFDAEGNVTDRGIIEAGGTNVGVNIPHAVYHTVVSLKPGSVFFEAKAGPFQPLTSEEKAPWAPAEGEPGAGDFHARMRRLFEAP